MDKFYVLHTTDIDNLLEILKSGTIYASLYTKKSRMSGFVLPYVYTTIYIPSVKNMAFNNMTLILDPSVIDNESCIFNKGWAADIYNKSILLPRYEDKITKNNKIVSLLSTTITRNTKLF